MAAVVFRMEESISELMFYVYDQTNFIFMPLNLIRLAWIVFLLALAYIISLTIRTIFTFDLWKYCERLPYKINDAGEHIYNSVDQSIFKCEQCQQKKDTDGNMIDWK